MPISDWRSDGMSGTPIQDDFFIQATGDGGDITMVVKATGCDMLSSKSTGDHGTRCGGAMERMQRPVQLHRQPKEAQQTVEANEEVEFKRLIGTERRWRRLWLHKETVRRETCQMSCS